MLKKTPFHPRVELLNVAWSWRRWAGHTVASQYEMTHEREYYAIRSGAGLIDVSPLYKYAIEGKDAERFLSYLLVRDARQCQVGQVHYTAWCNEDGHVLEDGVLFRMASDKYRLTAAEPNLDWFTEVAYGLDVTIEDISAEFGSLAVQGPNARTIVQAASGDGDLASLKYFWHRPGEIAGVPVMISRTGYTGDLGYEIWMDSAESLPVWDHLIAVGTDYGLRPAGMLALDVARIEAGLLLLDVDYTSARFALIPDQKSTPFELGFGWMLRGLKKDGGRRLIGRNAIERELEYGPQWAFVGLEFDWRSYQIPFDNIGLPPAYNTTAQRSSVPIYQHGAYVGYATSHTYSPLLKKHIALASVYATAAQPGTELAIEITVEHRRHTALANIVNLPFFDPPRKRA
ncbi:MAG: aminomethyltransferase family protein [Anaerolineae bacterium]|nr:aminomethyltransferase family protein [Anaerolineae bacterium]